MPAEHGEQHNMHPTRTLPGELGYLRGAHYPQSSDLQPGTGCFCCPFLCWCLRFLIAVLEWGPGESEGGRKRGVVCLVVPEGWEGPGCMEVGVYRLGVQQPQGEQDLPRNVARVPLARTPVNPEVCPSAPQRLGL